MLNLNSSFLVKGLILCRMDLVSIKDLAIQRASDDSNSKESKYHCSYNNSQKLERQRASAALKCSN